jgi:hypothetical protein
MRCIVCYDIHYLTYVVVSIIKLFIHCIENLYDVMYSVYTN